MMSNMKGEIIVSSQTYQVIGEFPPDKFNLLIPVQSFQEINPIYRIVINQVNISTELDDKEIYEEKNAQSTNGQKMYAITHKGLLKLTTAANGQIMETTRIQSKVCEKCIEVAKATGKAPTCGNCAARFNTAYRVVMKFPELSGGWRIVQATREIDFSAVNMSDKQKNKVKEFAAEHAESKAMSRCIRKGLSIKSAYTLDELKKPFVVAYPVLNAADKEVKQALIAGAVASSNLLFSGFSLPAQTQQALPESTENSNPVDKETGEIIETDYEAIAPDEIGHDQPESPQNDEQDNEEKYFCSNPECGAEIPKNINDYSIKHCGKPLCYKCQQEVKKKEAAKK